MVKKPWRESTAKTKKQVKSYAPIRNSLIAKIHIAKKQLGLDDDTYRQLLINATGKNSCAKLNNNQLITVVKQLKNKGWQPKRNQKSQKHYDGSVRLLYRYWFMLGEYDVITTATKDTLNTFTKKHYHQPVQWMSANDVNNCIQRLRSWAIRIGEEKNNFAMVDDFSPERVR